MLLVGWFVLLALAAVAQSLGWRPPDGGHLSTVVDGVVGDAWVLVVLLLPVGWAACTVAGIVDLVLYALVVRGHRWAVPTAAAWWLVGSGLLVVLGVATGSWLLVAAAALVAVGAAVLLRGHLGREDPGPAFRSRRLHLG